MLARCHAYQVLAILSGGIVMVRQIMHTQMTDHNSQQSVLNGVTFRSAGLPSAAGELNR
jgi:hypothetical protein